MSSLQQVVAKFLAERDQVITAINNCPASNMEDYWRWQGNAEARRVLSQDLERDGIDLTDEPRDDATVKAEAIREAAQVQRQYASDARTNNGQAEHEDFADWLDEQATAIQRAIVEGAHP
jgi:glutamyl-tRNA reductase